MLKVINRLSWIVVAVAVLAGISYWTYRYTENQRLIRKLEEEKAQLQQIVQRLTSQKRVAEMMLLGRRVEKGVPKMDLLFVEYARDENTPASIHRFVIDGSEAHIDAKVIQFERSFVFDGDPLRGVSVALFTRIYGDKTAPSRGRRSIRPGGFLPCTRGPIRGRRSLRRGSGRTSGGCWRISRTPRSMGCGLRRGKACGGRRKRASCIRFRSRPMAGSSLRASRSGAFTLRR